MAVRHINPNAKVTSGYIVSGKEADKVFALFDEENRTKEYVETKKKQFRRLFTKSTKIAS
jgi:hypothetical protein